MFATVCLAFFAFLTIADSIGSKPKLADTKTVEIKMEVGQLARLKCRFFTWRSRWTMTWYFRGKPVRVRGNKRIRQRNGRTALLRIRNVGQADAGMYKCVASNIHGSVSKLVNLIVVDDKFKPRGQPGKGPPWFVKEIPEQPFISWPASNDLNLRCRADGEPPLKYKWLKDGKNLKHRRLDPKLNAAKWYLRIKTAVPSDSGLYKCIVSNRLGNISSSGVKLTVIEKGLVRPVLSTLYPNNKTARIGDNVTFQCIELYPVLTDHRWLHWKKLPPSYPDLRFDNNSPSANSSYYTIINPKYYESFDFHGKYGARVLLNNVTKEDEGMYTCLIRNHLGKAARSAFLKIDTSDEGKLPEFVPQSYMTKVNKTVYLKCDFTAWYASWGMIWYKHDTIIQPEVDTKFQIVTGKSSFLIIKDVQKEDAGIFKCVASNAFGSVSKKMNLTVTG